MKAASDADSPPAVRSGALAWTLAVLCALWFADNHVFGTVRNENADLAGLIAGTADPPYRYRFLMPLILRGLQDALATAGLEVAPDALAFAVEAGLTLALFAAFTALVGHYVARPSYARLAGLSLLLPLVWHFIARDRLNPYYPWDVPQMLAFALALHALVSGRLGAFYLVLVAATLNRETSIVLSLLFLATFAGRMARRRLLLHLMAQVAFWLAVRVLAIVWLGGERGITSLEPGIGGIPQNDLFWATAWLNFDHFRREPADLLDLASIYVFGLIPLAAYAGRVPCPSIRRMLLVLPAFLAMCWLVGLVLEFRIYGEMIPLVWLALALLAAERLGLPLRLTDPVGSNRRGACEPASFRPS